MPLLRRAHDHCRNLCARRRTARPTTARLRAGLEPMTIRRRLVAAAIRRNCRFGAVPVSSGSVNARRTSPSVPKMPSTAPQPPRSDHLRLLFSSTDQRKPSPATPLRRPNPHRRPTPRRFPRVRSPEAFGRRSGNLGPSPCPSSWHGVTTILFGKVRRREVRPAAELRGDVIT